MDSSCEYMKFMGSGAGCLDYDFGGNKLYMGTCHSGANQIFYFEKNHGLMSGKGRYNAARIRCKQDYSKCLDYNPGNGDLYFGTCHTGTNRAFSPHTAHLHICLRGVHSIDLHGVHTYTCVRAMHNITSLFP